MLCHDSYRCHYCGKKDGQENLEVNHIVRIAKGSKSTMDNLQTLCHECNAKKGIKLIKRFFIYR